MYRSTFMCFRRPHVYALYNGHKNPHVKWFFMELSIFLHVVLPVILFGRFQIFQTALLVSKFLEPAGNFCQFSWSMKMHIQREAINLNFRIRKPLNIFINLLTSLILVNPSWISTSAFGSAIYFQLTIWIWFEAAIDRGQYTLACKQTPSEDGKQFRKPETEDFKFGEQSAWGEVCSQATIDIL